MMWLVLEAVPLTVALGSDSSLTTRIHINRQRVNRAMNTVQRFSLAASLVVIAAVLSVVTEPSLPAELVTNWDSVGEPTGTLPKSQAIWLLPAMMAGLLGLFAALPRIDPLRENIAEFRPAYDWFVVVFSAFLVIIHVGILAFNLGYEFPFLNLILAGVALLFYYTGVLLAKAKRNWFIGIRTPWTLSDDDVWNETHRVGAKLFKITAVMVLLGLAFGEYAIYFLLVPLFITAVGTVAYSYYLYERVER